MESLGAYPDGEWDSFSSIFDSDELHFVPHCIGHFSLPENYGAGLNSPPPSCFDPPESIGVSGAGNNWFYSLDALNTDFSLSNQEYRYNSKPNDISLFIDLDSKGERKTGHFLSSLADTLEEDHHQALQINGDMGNDGSENLDYNHRTSTAINPSNKEEQPKRKCNGMVEKERLSHNAKKKTRVSQHVKKSIKSVESSKSTFKSEKNSSKTMLKEDSNGGSERQSSSSCSSDEGNASREMNGGATSESKGCEVLNSNGKTRAGRGSATDPQSLYARKRRERINERLRILQKLVPNGTKVDISTMLEQAVHYVKFLQLQIKLLSSDDHWMYAPIAYNGMDIGLLQKISPLLSH